jgi:hypothetical protein
MIVDSKMECAQMYPEANIIPGRNAIPDDKGRELMQNKFFLDMINVKTGPHAGKVIVVVPPADEKMAAKVKESFKAAGPEVPTANAMQETAVSNLALANAIKMVRTLSVVDQIQHIAVNDPRPEVKEEAEARIEALAKAALKAAPVKDESGV